MQYRNLALAGCALSLVTLSAAAGANFGPAKENGGVTLTGTVAAINDRNEFLLDYGNGVLPIETDRVPSGIYQEGMAEGLQIGEVVTVSGWLDNTFRGSGVSAHTLVRDNGNQIYSSIASVPDYYVSYYQPEAGYLVMSGNVTATSGDEFTLDYGAGSIRVDAGEMQAGQVPPFTQTLRAGDEVVVTGWLDDDLFQSREMRASDIVRVSYHTAEVQ